MSKKSLVAQNITVSFSGLLALDQVSLSLETGSILGLIGPNGSGKTTFINAITGQVPLKTGSIQLAGTEISGSSPREFALLGILRSFQIVRLFDDLTLTENVETAALTRGTSRRVASDQANELLKKFNLQKYKDALAGELNYGDKRRVEIARALIAKPSFLLLDEPAAGMNEEESEALMSLLSGLPKEYNLGLLIIDHDMHLITKLCHKLHVISSGRTIAEGDVESVMSDPEVISAYLGTPIEEVSNA